MKELAESTQLQNKRCKNTSETALIVLEIDRRRMLIAEIGGQAPSDDVIVSVLWMAMDPGTTSHVSGKLDVSEVEYTDLRQAVMMHTSLTSATSNGGRGNSSPTAMDIGSIASVVEGEEETANAASRLES